MLMAIKRKCSNLWDFWSKGWIVVPTAFENPNNKFPSEIGRFIVSRFPGLEKNYVRLCGVGKGDFAVFASRETRDDNPRKILVYSDLRIPLSTDDFGLILLPDEAGSRENKSDTERTDWEIIEESIERLKYNLHLLPGTIFLPPLGYDKDRMEEEDSIDEMMALLLNTSRVEILYGFEIEKEADQEDKIKEGEKEGQGEKIDSDQKESVEVYSSESGVQEWSGENLIDDEFERIEINVPE
jgi:hypothetical protein